MVCTDACLPSVQEYLDLAPAISILLLQPLHLPRFKWLRRIGLQAGFFGLLPPATKVLFFNKLYFFLLAASRLRAETTGQFPAAAAATATLLPLLRGATAAAVIAASP